MHSRHVEPADLLRAAAEELQAAGRQREANRVLRLVEDLEAAESGSRPGPTAPRLESRPPVPPPAPPIARNDAEQLRREMQELRQQLQGEMQDLRRQLQHEMQELRQQLQHEMQDLREQVQREVHDRAGHK
ncbi:MAG: hypothetical protein ABR915_12480 [Thermoguttaceae bacterium]